MGSDTGWKMGGGVAKENLTPITKGCEQSSIVLKKSDLNFLNKLSTYY